MLVASVVLSSTMEGASRKSQLEVKLMGEMYVGRKKNGFNKNRAFVRKLEHDLA